MPIDLSFVVPLHNEEACVEDLFSAITNAALPLYRSFEIIFIDDGSTDNTYLLASTLAARNSNLRVVKLRRNYGQTAATVAGFDVAKGNVIVTMDGDLQNDPHDVSKMLQALDEGFDVISGWRYERKDKFFTRILPSKIANWIISQLTGIRLHDYGCALKAYRARFLKGIRFQGDMHRFFPALVCTLSGARVKEIRVNHYPRKKGKSNYGLERVSHVLIDMLMLLLLTRFIRKPIYYFALLATPFIAFGMFLAAFVVFFYSRSSENLMVVPGIAFLILSAGFHFVMNGLLAEYIIGTAEQNNDQVQAAQVVDLSRQQT